MSQFEKMPPVDLDMLTMALQSDGLEGGWWLDRETGEVIPAPEGGDNKADLQLIRDREEAPERFVDIDPLPASILIDLMESFICTLSDEPLCEKLTEAMNKQQPVWHFKQVLTSHPDHEDSWYGFKDDFYALQARQWLRDKGHDFEVRTIQEATTITKEKQPGDSSDNVLLELYITTSLHLQVFQVRHRNDENHSYELTAYQGHQDSKNLQVVAQSNLNQNQINLINQQISQTNLGIETDQDDVQAENSARLKVVKPSLLVELNGMCQPGNVFDQLYSQFNFLLGLSRLD
jgi:hypothetical protein